MASSDAAVAILRSILHEEKQSKLNTSGQEPIEKKELRDLQLQIHELEQAKKRNQESSPKSQRLNRIFDSALALFGVAATKGSDVAGNAANAVGDAAANATLAAARAMANVAKSVAKNAGEATKATAQSAARVAVSAAKVAGEVAVEVAVEAARAAVEAAQAKALAAVQAAQAAVEAATNANEAVQNPQVQDIMKEAKEAIDVDFFSESSESEQATKIQAKPASPASGSPAPESSPESSSFPSLESTPVQSRSPSPVPSSSVTSHVNSRPSSPRLAEPPHATVLELGAQVTPTALALGYGHHKVPHDAVYVFTVGGIVKYLRSKTN
tara:strand:- start:967 stop:1944 length:978 start_codon:yes stop_codon:yes gene_type:complete